MPADVHDRLRSLARQIEHAVPHVSTNEVLERLGEPVAATPVARSPRRRSWLTAVAAGLVAMLVGGLFVVDHRGREPAASPTTSHAAERNTESVVMPDLTGVTLSDAIEALTELGLFAVVFESDDVVGTFDTVISTDPVAGVELTAGASVRLTVVYPPQGGPLDFATSADPLPIWPHMSVSDPAATTNSYGLATCSGVATMRAAVDSTSGTEHSYYGTMCSFITLDDPRPSTVVSCATVTDGIQYARCQRRTDQTDTDGAGTHRPTTARGDVARQLDLLPNPTGWDVAATFGTAVSAATGPAEQADYENERVTVTVREGDANNPVSATIRLPGAIVEATASPQIVQSGLAYATYQDRAGTIDIVGIVPDDVSHVEIAGTTVPVTNNVWHYASNTEQSLDFVVVSNEARATTSTTS